MAQGSDAPEKPTAALPEVPTQITAVQVIAVLLLLFALSSARGVLAPLMLALLASLALAPPVRGLSRLIPRWVASAVRMVGASARRRATKWDAHIDEAGIAAGSMTLTRRDSAGRSTYSFFASDKEFVATRTPLTPQEARALIRLVQKALAPLARDFEF